MNPILAITLKILSAFAFTIMSGGIKYICDCIPIGQIVFFRSFLMLLPLAIWLGWRGNLFAAIKTHRIIGQLGHGFMASCNMYLNSLALMYLPLTDSVVLGYTTPLMLVFLAAIFLSETVYTYRWIGTLAGFAGVLVMMAPHISGMGMLTGNSAFMGVLIALSGALLTAGTLVMARSLVNTETAATINFYLALITSIISLMTIFGGWVLPSFKEFVILIFVGLFGGIGQVLLVMSFQRGDASLTAPFEYTTMLWACLIDWLFFGDWPTPAVIAGGGIVVAAGIYVALKERHKREPLYA